MSFSNHLRKRALRIWQAQFTHPFVRALGKGTLSARKFRYYILQDARYLEELSRTFAAGSKRATDAETALHFAKLVEETIIVERGLHESYGKRWKLSAKQMRKYAALPYELCLLPTYAKCEPGRFPWRNYCRGPPLRLDLL